MRLLKGETVDIPNYNFKKGVREYNGNYLTLGVELPEDLHGRLEVPQTLRVLPGGQAQNEAVLELLEGEAREALRAPQDPGSGLHPENGHRPGRSWHPDL